MRRIHDMPMRVETFRLADHHSEILDRLDRDGSGRSAVLRRLLDAIDATSGDGVIVIGNSGGDLRITADQRAAAG